MTRYGFKRSGLFLTELIIALLFFSLASAVCVQVFAGAQKKSVDATNLSMAITKCQTTAETWYYDETQLTQTLGFVEKNERRYLFLNQHGEACEEANAEFLLSVTTVQTEPLLEVEIAVTDYHTEKEIYSLPVVKYQGQTT